MLDTSDHCYSSCVFVLQQWSGFNIKQSCARGHETEEINKQIKRAGLSTEDYYTGDKYYVIENFIKTTPPPSPLFQIPPSLNTSGIIYIIA